MVRSGMRRRSYSSGWAEQDPDDWWRAAVSTLRTLTAKATDGEIAGIGLSGQMHSMVLLDAEDRVIRPALLWCDGRTAAECREIEDIVGRERLIEITVDGKISDDELEDFIFIQEELERISIAVETLQLWSEKMLATGAIDEARYNAHKNK